MHDTDHNSEQIGGVRFCQSSSLQNGTHDYHELVSDFWRSSFLARYASYFLVGLIVVMLAWKLEATFRLPWVAWPVIGLYAAAALSIEVIRLLKFRKWKKGAVADAAAPESRLCCIGDASDLLQYGEIADVPFEPRVFKASFALPRYVDIYLILLVLLILVYALDSLQGGTIMLISIACASIFILCLSLFRPTYFRLVPGKLEVLTFSFLKLPLRQCKQIDLRNAKVVADLYRNIVEIQVGGHVVEYVIRFLPEKRRFVHSLFQAAISTHVPAPLPADALLG